MNKYLYPKEVDVISGFGSGYEDTCQKMVIRGMKWFDAHPKADPQFHGNKNIYGIITEDNQDAKDLTKTIMKGLDATGAMHQACMSHIFYAHKNGWKKYLEEVLKRETASK